MTAANRSWHSPHDFDRSSGKTERNATARLALCAAQRGSALVADRRAVLVPGHLAVLRVQPFAQFQHQKHGRGNEQDDSDEHGTIDALLLLGIARLGHRYRAWVST